jgi:hypothetical protein
MIKLWKYLKPHEKCLVLAYFILILIIDFRVFIISGEQEPYVDLWLSGFGWIFALFGFTQSLIDYEYEEKEES